MMHFMAAAPVMREYQKANDGRPMPKEIRTEREHKAWTELLNDLMAKPEAEMNKDEVAYIRTIALLVQSYERERYKLPDVSPAEVLRELLSVHGLRQRDLVDIFGSEAAVSYAVSGKRGLTVEQIRELAERFRVSTDVFIVKAE